MVDIQIKIEPLTTVVVAEDVEKKKEPSITEENKNHINTEIILENSNKIDLTRKVHDDLFYQEAKTCNSPFYILTTQVKMIKNLIAYIANTIGTLDIKITEKCIYSVWYKDIKCMMLYLDKNDFNMIECPEAFVVQINFKLLHSDADTIFKLMKV